MYARKPIFSAVVFCYLVCGGCASRPSHVDVWADATFIAEQTAVISERRRTLDGLEQAVGAIGETLKQHEQTLTELSVKLKTSENN